MGNEDPIRESIFFLSGGVFSDAKVMEWLLVTKCWSILWCGVFVKF